MMSLSKLARHVHLLSPHGIEFSSEMEHAHLNLVGVDLYIASSSMPMCFLSMAYPKVSTVRSTTRHGIHLTQQIMANIVALIGTLYHALTAIL